ncbi:FAD-dependent monooxygenase [Trichophyton mentagrophytes]|nr:FAD-dependent monooxygenase [Trichophyton mentagrophytes]
MGKQQETILIIGAGISGLATSRLLTNNGIPNIVFEASTPDRSQGFAISLQEFGYSALLAALGDLPLSSLIRAVAPDRQIGGTGWIDQALRDNRTGELLVAPDLTTTKQTIVRANRNALRHWIADCGEDELDVRYGHKLQSIKGKLGDVTAIFENGAKYKGSLIIAADGVNSTSRSQILPDVVPETIPLIHYHGEFQLSHSAFDELIRPHSGHSNILVGVGDSFNTPLSICNITKTRVHLDWSYSRTVKGENDILYRPNVQSEEAKQIPPALLEELDALNLAEPWKTILNSESLKTHRVFHWTTRCVYITQDDARRAGEQGVIFVGDSWHAMPIFGGEGGNHALLDGVELADAIAASTASSGKGDWDSVIKNYYGGAWKRSQEAVRRSTQRFFLLHRPATEWKEISEQKKKPA